MLSRNLVIGDLIKLKIGDVVPTDVVINSGSSEFDFSNVTGETFPVKKTRGGVAYQGAVCRLGESEAVVMATGTKTFAYKNKRQMPGKSQKTQFEQANLVIQI